ncbi:MAG: poly-beta-1,6-N-acetyl-D-glucosamine synthase [Nitrospiria bacterium]
MSYFDTFLYSYPVFMTFLWMTGAVLFFLRREWRKPGVHKPPPLHAYPKVSILIPCHNEEETIQETIECLDKLHYLAYEVIAINDGSTDETEHILDALSKNYAWLRVIHLRENRGKATALNLGVLSSQSDFIVCVDADAMLDPYAVNWMMSHFINWPNVGAVTGNPRIRNCETLLCKIQVGEFSAIVGMIKRCQRILGKLFTISGVIGGFRRRALIDVRLWDTDSVTEDIDISWKLQTHDWDIRFEPRALCRILMPGTLKGLFKQRLRWAQGGMEVMLKNLWILTKWKQRRLYFLYVDYLFSVAWIYFITYSVLIWVVDLFRDPQTGAFSLDFFLNPPMLPLALSLSGSWHTVMIGVVCILQFTLGLFMDNCYEKGMRRYYFWAIWYPFVYWVIILVTSIIGIPKALFKKKSKFAVWDSPDRGIHL